MERMVEQGIEFQRYSNGGIYKFKRDKIIRTTFGDRNYIVTLSVIDSTWWRSTFPLRILFSHPKRFSFEYSLMLSKGMGRKLDLEEFEIHKEFLDNSMKHDSIMTYTSRIPQIKKTNTKDAPKPDKTKYIKPWDVKIPPFGKDD